MKKLLSLLLICTIVMSVIIIPYQANADVNISGDMDDANVKYFLNYAFTNVLDRTGERRVSSFDINTAGGVLNPGPGLNITDTSTVLPVEASRKMEDITYGEVVMEFPIVLSNPLDGAKIVLQNDDKLVFGLYFDKDTIYCNGKDGENLPLQAYKTKAVYAVKITMDFDKKTVKNICIDGKQVAENLDFANNSQKANNILISTGAKATGTFGMQSIRIYRGYFINESFSMNGLGMPPDWDLSVENGEITASTANISASNTFDSGSATLSSEYGNSSLKKTIDKKTDKSIFEFQLLLPKKRAGAEISLTAGEKNLFSIFTTKDGFAYSDKNGNPVDFYKSMDNVWYHFRIEYDPQTGKADLIMNGKKQVMGIDLPPNIKYVDGVNCDVIPIGDGDVIIDNILLFPYEEIEDYVPEPVPVPKDDIDIGMQMCSLWTEGLHFGYDYLNDADARKPVLGFYDEGSPEVADWEIKYMVEHGVDFQWYCWFKAGQPDTAIQDGYMSPAIHEGFFNARYSDQMKFAIMWENIGVDTFTSDIEYNKKCFLENVAPFWIEYFFKDPRYYKVNGRPLVGAYYLWKISEKFGDEGFKEMLTEFEQMCVDAGVGKPFFIQQVSKDAGTKDFYKRVEEWGASGSYAYNHGNIWPELMYDWNEEFEADAKETNIQFIPSVNPGFDAFPWGLDVGSLWNKDNMKTFLVNIRDKFFKTADTSILGRKILMLCSWNEFNEGHYFCPTQGTGFSFLDAVREVFVGDTPHEDVVPTTHQLDRINNLYPSDRVTPTREAAVDNNIPENSYIKAGWYFDKGLGEWNKGSGIKSCETSDDGLKITTTKGDTSIYVIPKNLEISNVSHIKIKIKNNSSANDLKLKYLTKTNESPNNQQYRTYIKPNLDEYTDVVIDIRKYPELWKGVAEKLQIEFSTVKDNENIEIKSVELFAQDKAEDAEKLTLSINGWEQKVDSTVIDNRLYVPLRTISDSFKGSVYWDPNTENIYMNVLDRKVVISPNSDTFTIDDEKITMANFKITQEDTTYVSLDFLATMFKKDVKWIDEKNLLEISDITSIDISQPNSERSVLYEADFNVDGNSQGYYLINANGDVSNGAYNITYDAGDPIVYAPDLSGLRLDTANAKMFAIGIKSNKDFDARVYFNTDKHRGISESQAFSFKVNASGETKEYSTLIKNPNWEGKLTGFRFDPGDFINNSIQIEYIKIYGDFDSILTKDEILMRYNSMKVSDEMISWDMNINNKKDGWEFNKSIVNVETKDGWTNFLTLENDASMNTIDVGKIEASDVKTIEMRLKNLTNGTKAKIYYKTDKSNVYDDSKAFYVDIKKNDEIGSIYTIDVSKSEKWEGEITGLKFSPSDEVGEISVDYINLLKK